MESKLKLEFKNVSNISNEEFQNYNVFFNISDIPIIMITKPRYSFIERNIAEELNLKVISCNYGADSYGGLFNSKIDMFINMLNKKYGEVHICQKPLNFNLKLLFEVDDKRFIYFIGTANNGQEIVTGVHLDDINTLDNELFKDTLISLDKEMYNYLEECNLSNLSNLRF